MVIRDLDATLNSNGILSFIVGLSGHNREAAFLREVCHEFWQFRSDSNGLLIIAFESLSKTVDAAHSGRGVDRVRKGSFKNRPLNACYLTRIDCDGDSGDLFDIRMLLKADFNFNSMDAFLSDFSRFDH